MTGEPSKQRSGRAATAAHSPVRTAGAPDTAARSPAALARATGKVEPVFRAFAPGASSGAQPISPVAEDSLYVAGEQLRIDGEHRALRPGDRFRISRGESHTARNPDSTNPIPRRVIAPPRR